MILPILRKFREFYAITFENQESLVHHWKEGAGIRVEASQLKRRLPILIIIPDHYFFFHFMPHLQGSKRKALRQAAQLQIGNLFPEPRTDERPVIIDTGKYILGCYPSLELNSLLKKHSHYFANAHGITTGLLLALEMLPLDSDTSWLLSTPGQPVTLINHNTLQYFSGDQREIDQRVNMLSHEYRLEKTTLNDLISQLSVSGRPWTGLQLSLPHFEKDNNLTGTVLKAALIILTTGLLFCAGQFFQLRAVQTEQKAWEQELQSLYVRALGPDHGSDPYGLLLFRANQTQNKSQGVNFIQLLGLISQHAPQGMNIENISMSTDTATITVYMDNYQQMEKLLEDLADSSVYRFTLDQADSVEGRINAVMSVSMPHS